VEKNHVKNTHKRHHSYETADVKYTMVIQYHET